MSSLVSVVMPAFNAANFLHDSIESVRSQTYSNWELIVVDDGSADSTSTVIQSFCEKDARIKYFYQENGGQGKARNKGLCHAKGNYIAFLDADDLWLPEKLEVQLKQLDEKQADLVFSECWVFNKTLSDATQLIRSGKGFFKGEHGLHVFLEQNQIPTLTVLMKWKLLEVVKGFTEVPEIQNAEDYHLWLRLLIKGYTFFGSELPLAAYREHAQASTHSDKLAISKVIEALIDIRHNCRDHQTVIDTYLRQWFKKLYYLPGEQGLDTYKELIAKNCNYTNNERYNRVFQLMLKLFGFRVTRWVINRSLNG